jgi:hypothetical protein
LAIGWNLGGFYFAEEQTASGLGTVVIRLSPSPLLNPTLGVVVREPERYVQLLIGMIMAVRD